MNPKSYNIYYLVVLCKIVLFTIITVPFMACNKASNKLERKNEPDIYSTQQDDIEMNRAIATAKKTMYIFKNALENNKAAYTDFCLKVEFKTPDRNEHIWVSDIFLSENTFYGIIDNLPAYTKQIKMGDTISIKNENIKDWMFLDGDELYGGYTIQVLRNRMTKKERDDFDKSYSIRF